MRTHKPELISYWREVIDRQQRSGESVRGFCRNHNVGEHSFYIWRQRLGKPEKPVSFALVETNQGSSDAMAASIQLQFPTGERLWVTAGADAATLRTVVAVLRERA